MDGGPIRIPVRDTVSRPAFQLRWCLPALAVCLLAACSGRTSPLATKRIIVLGIDGMDPKFVETHWDILPNLARLRQQGEFKRLATVIPPQSPVAWSTFITGMDPGGHGIYDFIHRDPKTSLPFSSMAETSAGGRTLSIGPYLLPLTSGKVQALRRGKAFWQTLTEHGIPVNIIRMPTNFPPVDCEGESLAGMGTPDMRGTFGTFTFFTDVPGEQTRKVPGGQIVTVSVQNGRADMPVEGPDNTLRKDKAKTFAKIVADVDPTNDIARFTVGDQSVVLKQGEWSEWIHVPFPLLPPFIDANGMIRIYVKSLHPRFQVYVSPVNIDPYRPDLPISDPASYSRDLAEAVGPYYTQGMAEDTAVLRQNVFTRQEYLSQSRLVSQEHLRLLRYGIEHQRGGLLFFHFFGIDQNSHMLWGRHDDELVETYKLVDQTVGWTLEHAGDATVIVMSDHGFSTFDRAMHLNAWLRKEGFLYLTEGATVNPDEPLSGVDWNRTEAYAVGLNGLYLSLKGRENQGVVEKDEADDLLKRISAKLTAAVDGKTGARMVDTVYEPRKLFHGDAFGNAPDLIVGFMPGYRASWQTALGGIPQEVVEDNTEAWIGDHCIAARFVPGVLISNRKSRVDDPALADLPATLLSEYGLAKEPGMTGRSIY